MRRYYKCIVLCIILAGISSCRFFENTYRHGPAPDAAWQAHNRHLIPTADEAEIIGRFDFDSDGLANRTDPDSDGDGIPNDIDDDIDADGVPNTVDPAPSDPREIGYHPFGILAFLSWRHPWNHFKYTEENLPRTLEMIQKTGASFVRVDFYWNDIEPVQGTFDFEKYDFLVDALTRHNIRILAILGYSADWAADAWNNPPSADEDFVSFCQAVTRRYRDRIKYWEIWNEPDSSAYWQPQDEMKRYTALLKKTYTGIKQEDPTAKVLLGGLTSSGYYALKRIYAYGGKEAFDIVNIHPFVNPLAPDAVERIRSLHKNIRRLMRQYGDEDKKIWFTEIGSPGVVKPAPDNTWWEGMSPDEDQQAAYVSRLYDELIGREGVEKIFWAYFRDNKDHFRSGVDYFGLIRWDFSPKEAYGAYQKAFRQWKTQQ